MTEHYLTTIPASARPQTHVYPKSGDYWVHINPDGSVFYDKDYLTEAGAKQFLYVYLRLIGGMNGSK